VRSLGLDVGDKRIGVAISDPMGILASPFTVIERQGDQSDIDAIVKVVGEQKVAKIIVGLPKSMDGHIGSQAEKVRSFAGLLRQRSPAPVEFRDERLTTVSAKRMMRESSARKVRSKGEYDAVAAAIILQGYLDENMPQTVAPE
jgi:putative holliday junction resolvase